MDLGTTVTALDKLGLFGSYLDIFIRDVNLAITDRLFDIYSHNKATSVIFAQETMKITDSDSSSTFNSLLTALDKVTEFLSLRLPRSVQTQLSEALMPDLLSKIVSLLLPNHVPLGLDKVAEFQELVSQVTAFKDALVLRGWNTTDDLTDWIENVPQVWLSKRREFSLDKVRRALSQELDRTHRVERVETQRVANRDQILGTESGNEWSKDWSDDEHIAPIVPIKPDAAPEEEDVSAWGLDEDTVEQAGEDMQEQRSTEEAWGWAEENGPSIATSNDPIAKSDVKSGKDGHQQQKDNGTREMTLRESYTVTGIPQALLDIVLDIMKDARTLDAPG